MLKNQKHIKLNGRKSIERHEHAQRSDLPSAARMGKIAARTGAATPNTVANQHNTAVSLFFIYWSVFFFKELKFLPAITLSGVRIELSLTLEKSAK